MASAMYTQKVGTGVPGQVYGDFSGRQVPSAEVPWPTWRGTGTPGRPYGSFATDPSQSVAVVAVGVDAGAVVLGEPSEAKVRYTQLRHGPLPGMVYGAFSGRVAVSVEIYAANVSSQAATVGSPSLEAFQQIAAVVTSPVAGQEIGYAENAGDAVATVVYAGWPEATLSLSGSDAALFGLSGDDIVWLAPPDFETPLDHDMDNAYELTVSAENIFGTFSVPFAVVVTNAPDMTPTITFPTDAPVQVPSGRAVAFNARSYDDASSRTWSITGGADAALFSVVGSTGRVSFDAAPDYADPQDADTDNDYQLTIQVVTSAGTDTQDVTVRVVEGGQQKPVLVPTIRSSIKTSIRGIS